MPSETDPLLPRGNTAPEISGYGFSNPSQIIVPQHTEIREDPKQGDDPPPPTSISERSSVRAFIAIFTIVIGFALVVTLFAQGASEGIWGPSNPKPVPSNPDDSGIYMRVRSILDKTPLIDGHDDLAWRIRYLYQNQIYQEAFTSSFERDGMAGQVDLPRLKSGQVGGSFWSAYTNCPANGSDFSDANYASSVSMTLSQIDLLHRITSAYPDRFSSPLLNSSVALTGFRDQKKLISPIGIEGLHQIGNSLSNLRLYHTMGVKYVTLTHNCHNIYADAAILEQDGKAFAAPPLHGGISDAGQVVIKEMNRVGMIVDLSHVSKNTMLDVLGGNPVKFKGSVAPIIFSHSSAFTICQHPRNVPDDVLQLVKGTGSLVMVNFAPDFISCLSLPRDSETGVPDRYPPNSTIHQVVRHITYIGNLIGYDHVGLGSDFDGIPTTPEGLDDVSKFPDLVAELLRAGVSDEDAAKIVGGNILRVWGEVEKTAARLQAEGVPPAEDKIEKMPLP